MAKRERKKGAPQLLEQYRFWKHNKVDEEFTLTAEQLKEKFIAWIKTKELAWLQYYRGETTMRCFITDKEAVLGLESVFENEDMPFIYDALIDVYLEYLQGT